MNFSFPVPFKSVTKDFGLENAGDTVATSKMILETSFTTKASSMAAKPSIGPMHKRKLSFDYQNDRISNRCRFSLVEMAEYGLGFLLTPPSKIQSSNAVGCESMLTLQPANFHVFVFDEQQYNHNNNNTDNKKNKNINKMNVNMTKNENVFRSNSINGQFSGLENGIYVDNTTTTVVDMVDKKPDTSCKKIEINEEDAYCNKENKRPVAATKPRMVNRKGLRRL